MNSPDPHLPWEKPDWLESAHNWITTQLAARDEPLTAPIERVHLRPWSIVLRAHTSQGEVFFKAAMPLLAGEAALQQALAEWHPECTLPVLAAEPARGWFLQPDGGWLLRSFLKTPDDLARIENLLQVFAAMQIRLAGRSTELLERVPFDRRLERLPELFAQLLEAPQLQASAAQVGLSAERQARLRNLLPRYQALCAELAASPIPHSLHHDDFHDGNIFATPSGEARFISDWGESCFTFPFFSMIVCLRALAYRVRLPDAATDVPEDLPPSLARLRDTYLAPWEQFAPLPELVRLFNLSWRAGMVNRALTWHAVVSSLPESQRAEYAQAAPGWLDEFLTLMER